MEMVLLKRHIHFYMQGDLYHLQGMLDYTLEQTSRTRRGNEAHNVCYTCCVTNLYIVDVDLICVTIHVTM